MLAKKIKISLILLIDLASFSLALVLMLILRYGLEDLKAQLEAHLVPFAMLFILWLVIFYLCNLYSDKAFKNKIELIRVFFWAVLINLTVSIVAFYIFGTAIGLTPKTNLVIFTLIFAVLNLVLRIALARIFILKKFLVKIIIIGDSESIRDTALAIERNPGIGFLIIKWIKDDSGRASKDGAHALGDSGESHDSAESEILETIKKEKVEMVVLGQNARQNKSTMKIAYDLIPLGIDIVNFSDFYESIYRKAPLDELSEEWFIEEIRAREIGYDFIKRIFDFVLSLALLVILSPLGLLVAILIRATNAGSAVYSQRRVGRNGQEFTLYKFRTMKIDAEKDGVKWAQKNDERITKIGKILRATHLDEMPQLLNIMKGNLSFVGPRPERPEFTTTLRTEIPHYEIRHTILPGLTGWAQINYRYGATINDAIEKLKYELYYHQNRSIIFDFVIILKTIRMVFQNH